MAQRPRMRPSFRIPVTGDPAAVLGAMERRLASGRAAIGGQVLRDHAYLRVHRDRRSLLSPCLNVKVVESDEGPLLQGRFSPSPNVWTGFMAIYGVLACCGIGGLMLGWAQTTVDEHPWGFYLFPAALLLMAFVYGAAVIGQGLTADEMYDLRAFVDRTIEEAGS